MSVEAEARREELVALFKEVSKCTKCPLFETRTKAVFGAGNADADLMFVGEAPGAEEDKQGLPFVGRAGGLLNELLGEIGLDRETIGRTFGRGRQRGSQHRLALRSERRDEDPRLR